MDREVLTNAADLGEIIRCHNEAVERLRAFRASRPYLVAPNLIGMLEGNLKDNVEVLYRELNNLTKPKSATRQYVCNQCHSVFLQRLPGGICDECRSRNAPGAGRYGGGTVGAPEAYDPKGDQAATPQPGETPAISPAASPTGMPSDGLGSAPAVDPEPSSAPDASVDPSTPTL
jgi:hypothetical protein